ncbi:MAG: xylan 1,4-beta-xylosidase [Clostridia bacterium]|nr:xylan 1,4-beta-xylosidase [Clostridia bacterium]
MRQKKEKRFLIKKENGGTFLFIDKKTGVNYLYVQTGYSGGLTVLVDAMGNPIVTPITEE